MSGLNLQMDTQGLEQVRTYLQGLPRKIDKVQERALNKAVRGVKTDASKEIRSEVTLKAKEVNRSMRVVKASAKRGMLAAALESTGKPVPLIGYQTRQLKSGVKVKVNKDSAATVIPHAFIATMRSGHKGVFQRKIRTQDDYDRTILYSKAGRKISGKQYAAMSAKDPDNKYSLPIEERFGSAVPAIFKRRDVMHRLKRKGEERLTKALKQELNFMLHKTGRSVERI